MLTTPDGRYLLERYEITYVTTGGDILGFLQGSKAATGPAIFIGDPDYGFLPPPERRGVKKRGLVVSLNPQATQTVVRDFTPLSETTDEVKMTAAALQASGWPEVRVFTGQQAVEDVLWQAQAPRLLHIATHGYFQEDTDVHIKLQLDTVVMEARSSTLDVPNPILRSGIALAGANVALRSKTTDEVWFVSYRGGFLPDNVAQIPPKPLSIQHNGAKGSAT